MKKKNKDLRLFIRPRIHGSTHTENFYTKREKQLCKYTTWYFEKKKVVKWKWQVDIFFFSTVNDYKEMNTCTNVIKWVGILNDCLFFKHKFLVFLLIFGEVIYYHIAFFRSSATDGPIINEKPKNSNFTLLAFCYTEKSRVSIVYKIYRENSRV